MPYGTSGRPRVSHIPGPADPAAALASLCGEVVRPPAGEPRRASQSSLPHAPACTTLEVNLAGKKKTTFAKLNREAKVREKRAARTQRKEQRQREAEAAGDTQHEVEDLSHLDVANVEGVEPDVAVKR